MLPRFSLLLTFLRRLSAQGNAVFCPCCGKSSRRFFPAGVEHKRPFAACAYCGSLERHRLIALMLEKQPLLSSAHILSIAPEEPLLRYFHAKDYRVTTCDLLRADVDVRADVCALPFSDHTFDAVCANHVLEHVIDDTSAMEELRRVVKAGSRAILQTPVAWDREETDEDPSASEAERIRRFGQRDHVRQYGRSIVSRFENAGWTVRALPLSELFAPEEQQRYGLEAHEIFFDLSV